MSRRYALLGAAFGAAVALTASIAMAQTVRGELGAPSMSRMPAATTSDPARVAFETLQVDAIQALQVRARIIYANRIDADQIQGVVHQSGGVEGLRAHGEIRAPEVTASVIYTDRITANSVIADAIYVRDLRLNR